MLFTMKKLLFILGFVIVTLCSCDTIETVSTTPYYTNRVIVYSNPYYYNNYYMRYRITPPRVYYYHRPTPPLPVHRGHGPQPRPHHGGRR